MPCCNSCVTCKQLCSLRPAMDAFAALAIHHAPNRRPLMDQLFQALCGLSHLLASRDVPLLLELHAGLVDLLMGAFVSACLRACALVCLECV